VARGEPLSILRLRTGREFSVINIAGRGALVEGAALLPGSHVDVHVMTRGGRVLVRCQVARCFVTRITADSVTYHSALAFEQPVDVGYAVPLTESARNREPGSGYPVAESVEAGAVRRRLTA
jgi:hypothetical protein